MAETHEPVRAVVFDFGGVLTTRTKDSMNAWLAADGIQPESFSTVLRAWLSRSAPAGTPIHRLETGELPAPEFEKLLAAELRTHDGLPVRADGLITRLFATSSISPPMVELVRRLRGHGVTTALLSNSWGNSYPMDLLTELFAEIVISEQVGLRKPDPGIYRLTMERIGLPAAQTVFVDDADPNVRAAEALGMHAVHHVDPDDTAARIAQLIPQLDTEMTRRNT